MNFRIILFSIILSTLTSCAKKSVLETAFECSNNSSISNFKQVKDIKNNFKISIPKDWKTELYYDEFESDIFTADTTKQLTQTYILDASWKSGELNLNKEFEIKVLESINFEIVSSKFENIQNKPAFWLLFKGLKNNFDYQSLNIYIKTSVDTYLFISTEIYGTEKIEERQCEALKIIKTIEII